MTRTRLAVLALLALSAPLSASAQMGGILAGGLLGDGRCTSAAASYAYPWHITQSLATEQTCYADFGGSTEKFSLIRCVTPTGTASIVAYVPGATNRVLGVAQGPDGATYFTDLARTVHQVVNGTITSRSSAGTTSLHGLAVDRANLWLYGIDSNVNGNGVSNLVRQPVNCPTCAWVPLLPAGTLKSAWGVTIAPNGRLYVADTANQRVIWVDPVTFAVTVVATGLSFPSDVAVSAAGEVFVSEQGASDVLEWTQAAGLRKVAGNGGISGGLPPMPGQLWTDIGIGPQYGVSVSDGTRMLTFGTNSGIGTLYFMPLGPPPSGSTPTAAATSTATLVATASSTATVKPTNTTAPTSTATALLCQAGCVTPTPS